MKPVLVGTTRVLEIFLAVIVSLLAGGAGEATPLGPTAAAWQGAREAERLIAAARQIPPDRRIAFVSGYFLGRQYHPETRTRIKQEEKRKPVAKAEATNPQPLPVGRVPTSFQYLDCMTYVEHVLAVCLATRTEYQQGFLPSLIDVMYDHPGGDLMNHHRCHFTSHWGDVNERKGHLVNLARHHPAAIARQVVLNRVGANRTFFVEDRFMIASGPQTVWYFPLRAVFAGWVPLKSGDILALATDKEGLDVTHMAFYIEHGGKRWFRHASLPRNRLVDEDFLGYLRKRKGVTGLMIFRPTLPAAQSPATSGTLFSFPITANGGNPF